jgi:hypothetical protein
MEQKNRHHLNDTSARLFLNDIKKPLLDKDSSCILGLIFWLCLR